MKSSCVIFDGYINDKGYGVDRINGRRVKAHRLSYCIAHGISIDELDGVVIRHKCDNPSCVNPNHLEPGTQAENILDMMRRGRHISPAGESSGNAKLSSSQVGEIRESYIRNSSTQGTYALAKKYGVSPSHIGKIVRKNHWK